MCHAKVKLSATILALMLGASASGQNILSAFRENYIVTGPSLTRGGGCDIKFQISLKVYPLDLGEHWRGYFAYTQTTVWDAYYKSAPFHDISFRPGIYFDGTYGDNHIQAALEHRSNGRPYWGNPLRTEVYDVDDYSRGMNYVKVTYDRTAGRWDLYAILKFGTGVGIGDYERYKNEFSQDLYLRYLGYATLGARYNGNAIGAMMEVTPLLSDSVLNAEAMLWWRFTDRFPALTLHAFYGYESMCDCYEGSKPSAHVRCGFKIDF